MFNFPLPKNNEIINVVRTDAVMDKYVFTIALNWPSSLAVAELNEGCQKIKQTVKHIYKERWDIISEFYPVEEQEKSTFILKKNYLIFSEIITIVIARIYRSLRKDPNCSLSLLSRFRHCAWFEWTWQLWDQNKHQKYAHKWTLQHHNTILIFYFKWES